MYSNRLAGLVASIGRAPAWGRGSGQNLCLSFSVTKFYISPKSSKWRSWTSVPRKILRLIPFTVLSKYESKVIEIALVSAHTLVHYWLRLAAIAKLSVGGLLLLKGTENLWSRTTPLELSSRFKFYHFGKFFHILMWCLVLLELNILFRQFSKSYLSITESSSVSTEQLI